MIGMKKIAAKWRRDVHHNETQKNDTLNNDARNNDAQRNNSEHNHIKCSAECLNLAFYDECHYAD